MTARAKHYSCELCARNVDGRHTSDGHTLHAKCATVLALLPDEADQAKMLRRSSALHVAHRARFVSAILKAAAKSRAGCVGLHFCRRGTGPLVGVYKNSESGMETDVATPWSIVCEAHGTLVCVETRADAAATSTDTKNFCDDCRYGDDKPGVY